MKKVIALVLSLVLVLSAVSALAATGLGSVTTVEVTAAEGEKAGKVSVNTTMCAVTLDENGVIVAVKFDAVQPAGSIAADGTVVGDAYDEPKTKIEKEYEYGMAPVSGIGKDWFEQAAGLEAWCIGKTVAEVLAMPTMDKGDGHHTCVPTDADLITSCTIDVGALLKALEKAAAAAN